MSVATLLAQLECVRRTGPDTWSARCPAHGDRHPSLAVRETDAGSILLFCRSGCATLDILAALGLEWADLFPKRLADRIPPQRRRFPATAVLATLDLEAAIISVAGDNLANGIELSEADRKRLRLASIRISRAREVVSGH